MWLRKLFIFFSILFYHLGYAQSIVADQYTSDSGLDSNEILKIFQDSRQTLWVTTRYGTYVKDMNHFRRIDRFNEIQFSNVRDIKEDQNKNLWFASYGHGIVFFNGSVTKLLTEKDGLLTNRFQNLYLFKNKIYAGGYKGVVSIDPNTFEIKNYHVPPSFKHTIDINSFVEMKGELFITTLNHGVFRVDENGLQQFSYFTPILSSFSFDDKILFSSNKGVTIFNQNQLLTDKTIFREREFPVIWDYSPVKYPNNKWVITSDLISGTGRIFKNVGREFRDITKEVGISSDFPRGIVYDKYNNVVYISTLDKGLYRLLLNMPFEYYPFGKRQVIRVVSVPYTDYLLTPRELHIQENHQTKRIIGAKELYAYYQNHKHIHRSKVENNDQFFPIDFSQNSDYIKLYDLKQYRDSIYLGSNIGIFRLDMQGKILGYIPIHGFKFAVTENALIDLNPYRDVKIIHDFDRMTYSEIDKNDPNRPTNIVSTSSYVRSVYLASSLEGLFRYENGKFHSYLQDGEFLESKLKIVKCISNSRLLVATEAGDVYVLKAIGDRLIQERKISHKQINDVNISLLNEVNASIIIGTNKNAIIVSGDQFFYLDKEQGFKYNNIYYSSIQGTRLIVATDEGYYSLNIHKMVQYVGNKPQINISGITINNAKFARSKFHWFNLIDRKLKLKSDENNIIVDFIIINPKYSYKYKYRYRLNPNEAWSEYFTEESIKFNSLKYGNYHLELEITDLTGGIKTILPLLEIKIDPPFYLNIYFIAGNILVIVLILLLLYRRKIKNIKLINDLKINQIVEINKAEKKRISLEKKLSEVRLMALQSQMNPHFIFNILNSIQYYIIDNDVDNALECLSRFATLIRKMLDLSSKSSISLIEEIKFLELYVQVENFRYKNKINFSVYTDPEMHLHEVMFPPMLLQPLLENSIVHGFDTTKENNTISVHFEKEEDYLHIIIDDNGRGLIASEKSNKLHESKGLKIIRDRLKLFNQENANFVEIHEKNPGTRAIVKIKLLN